MRTQPDPSKMFLLVGPRRKRSHLGFIETFVTGKQKPRTLCGAKLTFKASNMTIENQGKVTCPLCMTRYHWILNSIKRLGLEWVCYGHYLPLENRQYKASLPKGLYFREK